MISNLSHGNKKYKISRSPPYNMFTKENSDNTISINSKQASYFNRTILDDVRSNDDTSPKTQQALKDNQSKQKEMMKQREQEMQLRFSQVQIPKNKTPRAQVKIKLEMKDCQEEEKVVVTSCRLGRNRVKDNRVKGRKSRVVGGGKLFRQSHVYGPAFELKRKS